MVAQPSGIVNHPAWVIGHLTYSCQELIGVIGLPAWLPDGWAERFGTGIVPWRRPECIKQCGESRGAANRLAQSHGVAGHEPGFSVKAGEFPSP
jgi:hypothetical protein